MRWQRDRMKARVRRMAGTPVGMGALVFALMIAMVLGAAKTELPTASAKTAFSDVSGHWAEETINWAVKYGIVNGYPDGTFKPDNAVSEAEFLVMLFRAYPQIEIPRLGAGDPWHMPYYALAQQYNWPIFPDSVVFNRGRVAQVLAASQGRLLPVEDAVRYLLDSGLASGRTAPTVKGFAPNEMLKRAEALTLIRNMLWQERTLSRAEGSPDKIAGHPYHIRGVAIGYSEADVIAALGQPARKDRSEYGFEWYVYNQDYSRYVQVGIRDGKVVGLYTNSTDWTSGSGIGTGSPLADLIDAYGEPLAYIEKNNVRYAVPGAETAPKFLIDGAYVTLFLDVHAGHTVTAVQIIEQQTEQRLQGYYGEPDAALRESFERQLFDLANAVRVQMGKAPFTWDETAARTARAHSADMAQNDFFDHVNLQGQDLGKRLKAVGVSFRFAAENIAMGQTSAIFAHHDWMNSQSGHRDAILGDTTHLGVGVYLGGNYHTYYTQNFYTPS